MLPVGLRASPDEHDCENDEQDQDDRADSDIHGWTFRCWDLGCTQRGSCQTLASGECGSAQAIQPGQKRTSAKPRRNVGSFAFLIRTVMKKPRIRAKHDSKFGQMFLPAIGSRQSRRQRYRRHHKQLS